MMPLHDQNEIAAMEWIQNQVYALFKSQIETLPKGFRVAIAGANIPGLIILQLCKTNNIQVETFFDDYKSEKYHGIQVAPFSTIPHFQLDAVILATIRNEKVLHNRLVQSGYVGYVISRRQDNATPSQHSLPMSKSAKPLNGLPGRDWPLNVQLQTSSVCNARCIMCPYQNSWHKKQPGIMSHSLFEKIITDMEHYRIGKLCLYLQNEPLADRRWLDFAKTAISRLNFQRLEISTNCSLLDQSKTDQLFDILQGIPHEVWISFHGSDKKNYENIMGLNFDTVVRNMAYFIKQSQERNVSVRVHACGTPARKDKGIQELVNRDDFFAFLKRFTSDHGLSEFPKAFFPFHDRAGHLEKKDLCLEFVRENLRNFYCHRIDTWIHILYNGDVISCCNDYHRSTVMGNLEQETLIEFFRSKPYTDFRAQALGLTDSPPDFICKHCAVIGG